MIIDENTRVLPPNPESDAESMPRFLYELLSLSPDTFWNNLGMKQKFTIFLSLSLDTFWNN